MANQTYLINADRTFSAANYNTYVHGEAHPDRVMAEHDFVYILSGSWDIYQEDIKYTLKADDAILLHAGVHHYGTDLCASGTKTIYIHFSSAHCDTFESASNPDIVPDSPDSSLPPSEHTVTLPTVIHCQNNPHIKSFFSDIVFARITQAYGSHIRMNALLNLLLLELQECAQEKIHSQNELLQNIIKLFQINSSKNYTLQDLSKIFYISGKTINRHFINTYGKTAHCYQQDLKLTSVSEYILEHPDATLRMAALNHGFYDEFHLSKAFKKKYGIAPDYYRRQHLSTSRESAPSIKNQL